MPDQSREAPYLWLGAAVVIGSAGDYLLRGDPWGLGFTLWVGLACGLGAALEHRRGVAIRTLAFELAPPLVFAAGVALHDSPILRAWNVVGTALWLLVPIVGRTRIRLTTAAVGDFVVAAVCAGAGALAGLIPIDPNDTPPIPPQLGSTTSRKALVGVALAIPLLLVFGHLLSSADPLFDRALRWLWRWDLDVVLSHLVVTVVLAWLAAGYLAMLRRRRSHFVLTPPVSLGSLEVAVPLAALATLFLIFDVVQVRYVIGGAEYVRATLGLTFADHARRGFFELVAATGLLLPVLLGSHWALDGDVRATKTHRWWTALVLIAAAPIPVSALWRLGLYVEAYGLTDDRVYATAFMLWATWCLAWLGITLVRHHADRFAFGAWIGGFVVLIAVNAANPDALVARVNLDRAAEGRELDTAYLARLSADAAPDILRSPQMEGREAWCTVWTRWTSGQGDWRSANLARGRAGRAAQAASAKANCTQPEP